MFPASLTACKITQAKMRQRAPLALQGYNHAAVLLGTVVRFAGRVNSLLLLTLPLQFADKILCFFADKILCFFYPTTSQILVLF